MEFKKEPLKLILFATLLGILLIGLIVWEASPKADLSSPENIGTLLPAQDGPSKEDPVILTDSVQDEDPAIQEQLDRDRQQQKKTKDLRIKLEQTNLELEEEKTLTEINKLKSENAGASYQVKEKSNPTDNIQVVAISDSSVTLHFNSPQALTKTIEYKPE